MRLIVAEGPRRHAPHWNLGALVREAAAILGDDPRIFDPAAGVSKVDAVIWDSQVEGDSAVFAREGVPTLCVVLSDEPPGPPVSIQLSIGPQPDHIRVSDTNISEASRQIAEWLNANVVMTITLKERGMLEVVAKAVRDAVESRGGAFDDPDDAAQVLAAAETIETQLRTPRPSRRALSWAVSQLAQVPVGLITGVASGYLTELIQHFTR